jgi:hypothetical protein
MSMLILSLCKVQTVSFEKLASAFDSKVISSSSLRQIQRLLAHFSLDSDYGIPSYFWTLTKPRETDPKYGPNQLEVC